MQKGPAGVYCSVIVRPAGALRLPPVRPFGRSTKPSRGLGRPARHKRPAGASKGQPTGQPTNGRPAEGGGAGRRRLRYYARTRPAGRELVHGKPRRHSRGLTPWGAPARKQTPKRCNAKQNAKRKHRAVGCRLLQNTLTHPAQHKQIHGCVFKALTRSKAHTAQAKSKHHHLENAKRKTHAAKRECAPNKIKAAFSRVAKCKGHNKNM